MVAVKRNPHLALGVYIDLIIIIIIVNHISISPFIFASVICVFLSVDSSAVIIKCSKLQVSEMTCYMLFVNRERMVAFP